MNFRGHLPRRWTSLRRSSSATASLHIVTAYALIRRLGEPPLTLPDRFGCAHSGAIKWDTTMADRAVHSLTARNLQTSPDHLIEPHSGPRHPPVPFRKSAEDFPPGLRHRQVRPAGRVGWSGTMPSRRPATRLGPPLPHDSGHARPTPSFAPTPLTPSTRATTIAVSSALGGPGPWPSGQRATSSWACPWLSRRAARPLARSAGHPWRIRDERAVVP
jgi:hypothetical protein